MRAPTRERVGDRRRGDPVVRLHRGMLPILNRAPGGPVSLVSTINSRVDLVGRKPSAGLIGCTSSTRPASAATRACCPPTTTRPQPARCSHSESAPAALLHPRLADIPDGEYFRTAARRIGLPIFGSVNATKARPARAGWRSASAPQAPAPCTSTESTTPTSVACAPRSAPTSPSSSRAQAYPIRGLFDRFGKRRAAST